MSSILVRIHITVYVSPVDKKARVREQNITQAHKEIAKTGDEVTVSFTRTAPRLLTE